MANANMELNKTTKSIVLITETLVQVEQRLNELEKSTRLVAESVANLDGKVNLAFKALGIEFKYEEKQDEK